MVTATVAALTAIGSTLTGATGTAAAIVGGTAVAGTAAAAGTAAYSAKEGHDERKALKSAAHDADMKAQSLAQKAKDAEQNAKLEATEKARKKQAAQTQTIVSSPLGVTGQANVQKPKLLGVG